MIAQFATATPQNAAPNSSLGLPASAQNAVYSAAHSSVRYSTGAMVTLWRRRYFVLLITLIGFALGFLATVSIRPLYYAEAAILLETNTKSATENARLTQANEIEILRSHTLARLVIERLDLMRDPEFNHDYRRALRQNAPELLHEKNGYKRLNIYRSELESLPASMVEQKFNTVIEALGWRLQITPAPSGGAAIRIGFFSEDAAKAARISNIFAETYITHRQTLAAQQATLMRGFLDTRLLGLRADLARAEYNLAEFRARHDLPLQPQAPIPAEKLSDVYAQLIAAKADLAGLTAQRQPLRHYLEAAKNQAAAQDSALSALLYLANNSQNEGAVHLRGVIEEERALSARKVTLSQRYGPKHPEMIALNAALDHAQGQTARAAQSLLKTLTDQEKIIAARIKTLEENLGHATEDNEAAQLGQNLYGQLNELSRDLEVKRLIYQNFLQNYQLIEDDIAAQAAPARILSHPLIPQAAAYPDKARLLVMALLAAFALAALSVLIRERFDRTLRSAAQMEALLGAYCAGSIPKLKAANRSALAQIILDKPASLAAESVRALRSVSGLRHQSAHNTKPKIIMVTSSLSGEGKTTLACWMARLAARSGEKTLLIDADLRNPSVHKALELGNDGSFVELLTARKKLSEAVQNDKPSGLHVICGKSVPSRALDLIGAAALPKLLQTARKDYDVIIIDTPAALAVADARMIAQHCDQVIYAVEWNKTSRDLAARGLAQFADNGANRTSGAQNLTLTAAFTHVDVQRYVRYGYGDSVYYYGSDSKAGA
ncbi:MAG: GumC family protein [Alphaproteobacteria bacterium]